MNAKSEHESIIGDILLSECEVQMACAAVFLRFIPQPIDERHNDIVTFLAVLPDADSGLQNIALVTFGKLVLEVGLDSGIKVAPIRQQIVIADFGPLVGLVYEVDNKSGLVGLQH